MASSAQGVGLDPRVFDEGKGRISIERFGAMLLDLVAASGDEAFGLAAAEAYALGDSGHLGFAMMNAPNLGEMWCLYSEISELAIEQTNYSFIEADGDVINLHSYSPLMRHHDVFQDYTVTIFIRHIRVHAGPDWMPVKIELERPAPRNPAPWRRIFGSQIVFGQHVGKTHIRASDMTLSNPAADPRLFHLFRDGLVEARDALHEQRDVVQRLRQSIQRNLHMGRVDLASMARDMAYSERSLQRRLTDRGLRFDQIVQSVRRDLAHVLLGRPDMRLEDVAERCGYSTSASFSRAISNWYGIPSAELRKRLLTSTPR